MSEPLVINLGEEPSHASSSVSANAGALSVSAHDGAITRVNMGADHERPSYGSVPETDGESTRALDGGIQRVNMSDLGPASGVLATARHPQLGHAPAQLTDTTLVEIGGMQLQLKEAARLGFVHRDAQGNFSEIGSAPRKGASASAVADPQPVEQPKQEAADQDDGPQAFAPDSEALVAYLAKAVPPELQTSIVQQVVEKGIDGLDLKAASLTDLSPDQLRTTVDGVSRAFQAQADSWLHEQGFQDHSSFYEWAREQHPDKTAAAMRTFVASRNPKVFSGLLQAYRQSVMPSTESLVREGYQVRTEKDGSRVVKIDGQWLSVAAAAKLGLV
jgi:hypothetical protein